MPELAECKIMSEYVNKVVEGKNFVNIRKSEVSKVKTDLKGPWNLGFGINSEARGKEIKINFIWRPECFKEHIPNKVLLCGMGMSGHWVFAETGKSIKHAHLMFDTDDGYTLSLVDARRFAKWTWSEDWSENRGPDPVFEFEKFVQNIFENINKAEFKKPIYEVMLNQKYFNGIGNYLRAEILYRLDIDPFRGAEDVMIRVPGFFEMCRRVPAEAYSIGGGQLKDWKNPFEVDGMTFDEWIQCYDTRGMASIEDKSGRRFWYNKKWRRNEQTIEIQ